MKRSFFYAVLSSLFLLVCLSACTSNENSDSKPSFELLNVERSVAFSAIETNKTVKIVADCHWEVVDFDNSEWPDLAISPRSGEGNGIITLTSNQNHSSSNRTAKVTVKTNGGLQQVITVYQTKSGADLSVNQEEFRFDDTESTQTLEVSSNTDWEILGATGIDWLELSQASGSSGITYVDIKLKEVFDDASRSTVLTVSAGNLGDNKIDVHVFQTGKSSISLSVSTNQLSVFSSAGGTETVKITCNVAWQVSISSEAQQWIHVIPTSGIGNGEIQVTCDPNIGAIRERQTLLMILAGTENPQQDDILILQSN